MLPKASILNQEALYYINPYHLASSLKKSKKKHLRQFGVFFKKVSLLIKNVLFLIKLIFFSSITPWVFNFHKNHNPANKINNKQ